MVSLLFACSLLDCLPCLVPMIFSLMSFSFRWSDGFILSVACYKGFWINGLDFSSPPYRGSLLSWALFYSFISLRTIRVRRLVFRSVLETSLLGTPVWLESLGGLFLLGQLAGFLGQDACPGKFAGAVGRLFSQGPGLLLSAGWDKSLGSSGFTICSEVLPSGSFQEPLEFFPYV